MTAPDGSVTRPRRVPVAVWAATRVVKRLSTTRLATGSARQFTWKTSSFLLWEGMWLAGPTPLPPSLFRIINLNKKFRQAIPFIGLIVKYYLQRTYQRHLQFSDALAISPRIPSFELQRYFHLGGI